MMIKISSKWNRTRAKLFWQQSVHCQAVDGDVLGGGQKVEGQQQDRQPKEVAQLDAPTSLERELPTSKDYIR